MTAAANEAFPLAGRAVRRIGFGAMQLPGPGVFGPPPDRDAALGVLRRAVELGVNHIRLFENGRRSAPEDQPGSAAFDEQLDEMVAMRDEGMIRAVGLSNVSLEQLEHGLARAEIACVQNALNVVDRAALPQLERCRSEGIPFVPFFPLGSAFDSRKRVLEHPAVRATAQRLGALPSQIAIAWLLALAPNVLLIPGTSSPQHLEQNLAAADLVLDDEALASLDERALSDLGLAP